VADDQRPDARQNAPEKAGRGWVTASLRRSGLVARMPMAEFVRHDTIENHTLKYNEIRNRYETMTRVRLGGRK
jgi:hypothetical protein